ncbi:tetratricopeptide repeat protein [Streptomyces avermitilis]|uniref:tetratricopeptide repeat protein n=1 Tax=Streptomyces avermitilis TaxID=33903 RepID=UPI0033AE1579
MTTTERAVLIRYQRDGESRVGSGLWIGGRYVLTADHCAEGTNHQVRRGGVNLPAVIHVRSSDPNVDLAVLEVPNAEPLEPMGYARVDRSMATRLEGCQALGFPWWKVSRGERLLVQLDGYVPTAEGLTANSGGRAEGHLTLKAMGPEIADHPVSAGSLDRPRSPWGGMSGAVVIADGLIIGVVRSHNLREGGGSLTITPIDAIRQLPAPVRDRMWAALGVPAPESLPALPGGWLHAAAANLAVPLTANGMLPTAGQVDMYDIGVSPSPYRDTGNDGYVKRKQYDQQIHDALRRRRFVLIVGPSKAGKSRLAFQAVESVFREAKLIVPVHRAGRNALADLFGGSGLEALTRTPSVLWLDDLYGYLRSDALDRSMLNRLLHADSQLVVVATMTHRQYQDILTSEVALEARMVLQRAGEPVRVDGTLTAKERQEAALLYPEEDFSGGVGIGEQLVAAPYLKREFDNGEPAGKAVVQAAADWTRAGMDEPIPQDRLWELARPYLAEARPIRRPKALELIEGVEWACTPIASHVSLISEAGVEEAPCYAAHDYIVSYLDGQGRPDQRPVPIPDYTWQKLLTWAEDDEVLTVGYEAALRRVSWAADEAGRRALSSDDPEVVVMGRFFLGQVAFERGDYRDAVDAYQEYLADPIDESAYATVIAKLNLGRALDAIGSRDEALRLTGEVIASNYYELAALAHLNVAKFLLDQGRFDAAVPILEEAMTAEDEEVTAGAHVNLALIVVLRDGDAEAAERHLQEALKSPLQRIQAAAHIVRGKIAEDNGDLEAAKEEFERVLALDDMPFEERAVALANLGEVLRHLEGMGVAENFLRQAIASDLPNAVLPAKISLGRELLDAEHFHDAEILLEEVMASGYVHFAGFAEIYLGWLRAATGDLESALQHMTQATRSPHLTAAHNAEIGLGYVLLEQDQPGAAREALERAASSPVVRVRAAASVMLGDLLNEEGESGAAERHWAAALESGNTEFGAVAALRCACAHEDDADVAIPMYREAMKSRDPEVYARAADLLGNLLEERGGREEAALCYRKAVESDHPRWSVYARIDLALLEHQAGRLAEVESLLGPIVESDDIEVAGPAREFLAESRLLLGAADRAVPLFRSILGTGASGELRARANLGLALLMCGEFSEAEPHFAAVIAENDPEISPLATVNMGLLKVVLGHDDEAAELYRATLDSANPTAAALAGMRLALLLLTDTDGLDEARGHLDTALASEHLDPAVAQIGLVQLSQAMGDLGEAERLAVDALTRVTGQLRMDLLLQLGIVRLEQGNDRGALEPLTEAAESSDVTVRSGALHALAGLHRERGETSTAREIYQTVVACAHPKLSSQAAADLAAMDAS